MDSLNQIILVVGLVSILASLCLIWGYRLTMRRTIAKLTAMVDDAIQGNFEETMYDESTMSALEAKLNRYLRMTTKAEHGLASEKNRIHSLISDISHQTKTPLSNIVLYTELLQEETSLPKHCDDMVDQIALQSEKLQFLIHALVQTSRLEAGIISVSPTVASVSELIACSVEDVRQQAAAKDIQLQLPQESITAITAVFDPKWTAEAIHNLLDNAIKYTPHSGSISIRATSYELFCRIDITDTGVGIAEQDINQIFQRFYRAASVSAENGVGIGLYLAREMILAQRGYIRVTSVLGKGSTFSVFLPSAR